MVMKPGTVGQDSAACEKRRDSGSGRESNKSIAAAATAVAAG